MAEAPILKKDRLIYLPVIMVIVAIFLVTFISYIVTRGLFINQLTQDGYNYAELLVQTIRSNQAQLDFINQRIERDLRQAAFLTLANADSITNERLAYFAQITDTDEIFWYSPEGEILNSSTGEFIGWRSTPGDPIDRFNKSGLTFYSEPIRKSTDTDEHFKFVYSRNEDGYFVQAGMYAEHVYQMTEDYSLQNIVERTVDNESIYYAFILDENLVAIADSQPQYAGVSYADNEDYQLALRGTPKAKTWFREGLHGPVLEVAVPFYNNGDIEGVLAVGISQEELNLILRTSAVGFLSTAIVLSLAFFWVQQINIIKPIGLMDKQLRYLDFNLERRQKLNFASNDPFAGLYCSINSLLERIYVHFEKNEQLRKMIEALATKDPLTGLPNRRVFGEHLNAHLEREEPVVVLMLDIDNFKDVNDTFGHVYGDQVLIEIGKLLLKQVNENVGVYRFGGDEFLLLVRGAQDADAVISFVENLISIFNDPIRIAGDELYVQCSIGIAVYPEDAHTETDLVMFADLAMYSAKLVAKSSYVFYHPSMGESLKVKTTIEKEIRRALEEDGFTILYQPKVASEDGTISGYEALLRVQGLDYPILQVIEVAEERGFIVEIGRWVIREVIHQMKRWKDKGLPPKSVAINLSARQLYDEQFIPLLQQLLDETGIQPSSLEIEITENLLINQEETTLAFLKKLKEMGITISMDDFGKAYSSLNYLTFLPVDVLKLDRSIANKYSDEKTKSVIKGIITIARDLNLKVVAEGVETVEQYLFFREIGCDYIQGYVFSRPLCVEAAEEIYNEKLEAKSDVSEEVES